MWNNRDTPLAFLITFRCYGTWLHGDERGSVNRFRNKYKTSYLPPNKNWIKINTQRLKSEIVTLDAEQRNVVENAIRETCKVRKWRLDAINVRTNHIHTVVFTDSKKPEIAQMFLRQMRPDKCAKAAVGKTKEAHGRTKAVRDIYGTSEV